MNWKFNLVDIQGSIYKGVVRELLRDPLGNTPDRPSQNPPTFPVAVDPCMSILGHNSGQFMTRQNVTNLAIFKSWPDHLCTCLKLKMFFDFSQLSNFGNFWHFWGKFSKFDNWLKSKNFFSFKHVQKWLGHDLNMARLVTFWRF